VISSSAPVDRKGSVDELMSSRSADGGPIPVTARHGTPLPRTASESSGSDMAGDGDLGQAVVALLRRRRRVADRRGTTTATETAVDAPDCSLEPARLQGELCAWSGYVGLRH